MKNRVERFNEAYKYLYSKGIVHKKKDVAEKMRASSQNVSAALCGKEDILTDNFLLRFCAAYEGIFNLSWLKTGEGQMLSVLHEVQGSNIIQGTSISNIQQVNGLSTVVKHPFGTSKPTFDDAEVIEVCEECGKPTMVPLVPANIAQASNEDVWVWVLSHKVPRTPVVHQLPNYHMKYQIHSDAMAPRLKSGDYVALRYIGPHPKIFNGEVYCIDTKYTGFVVREVTNTPDGYKLHARSERYEDDYITYEQVLGVYEVVGAIIMTI